MPSHKRILRDRTVLLTALLDPTPSPLGDQIARFYLNLHEDWRWVMRRVETIEVVDCDDRERRVSVDFRIAEVLERARAEGLGGFAEVPVPLGMFPKTLLLDFDIRDVRGATVSLFTNEQDARLAQKALIAAAAAQGLLLRESRGGRVVPALGRIRNSQVPAGRE